MEKKVSLLQLLGSYVTLLLVMVGSIVNFHLKIQGNTKDIQRIEETSDMDVHFIKSILTEIKDDVNNQRDEMRIVLIELEKKEDKE